MILNLTTVSTTLDKTEHYRIEFVLVLIYPLIPLVAEYASIRDILDSSITLITAIYAFSVFATSKKISMILSGAIPGILFLCLYANIIQHQHTSISLLIKSKKETLEANASLTEESLKHDWIIFVAAIIAIITIAWIHNIELRKRYFVGNQTLDEN